MTFNDLTEANQALNLADLATANAERCHEIYHPIDAWSPTDWACALGGEAGECLNEVKKLRRWMDAHPGRTDYPPQLLEAIGREIADTVIYADLLCQRLGISLEGAVRKKFNAVSFMRGSDIRI